MTCKEGDIFYPTHSEFFFFLLVPISFFIFYFLFYYSYVHTRLFFSLAFLRPMLKFSVQTFYQPFFSHSFPFSNFPLAILFPSKASHTKKAKASHPKAKAKGKKPLFFLVNSGKQSGAAALGEGHSNRRNLNSCFSECKHLGEIAVLLPGLCQSWKSR
jgi:hypothetical protein